MNELPTSYDIWFEKFIDPYEQDIEDDEYDEFVEEHGSLLQGPQPRQALITPMGILSMKPEILAGSEFKFWIGHTNFTITPKIVSIIEQIPGVETIDVWTRYRFRLGVGRLFKDSSVMFELKEAAIGYLNDITRQNTVS